MRRWPILSDVYDTGDVEIIGNASCLSLPALLHLIELQHTRRSVLLLLDEIEPSERKGCQFEALLLESHLPIVHSTFINKFLYVDVIL